MKQEQQLIQDLPYTIPLKLQAAILDGTDEAIYARYASLPDLAEQTDFGFLDRNIVVVDTEATGFSFVHDELTQIAAARVEEGRVVDWFVTFVNPGKPIPEDVSHLTNIYDSDVVDAPSPLEAIEALVRFTGDATLVAHNVNFDKTFLTKQTSGYPLLENTWIDSLDLARIALPRLKSHRLIDLVRAFDLPLSTHRADDDVRSTCAILRILFAAILAMPSNLVNYIASLGSREDWSTRIVFEQIAALKRDLSVDMLSESVQGECNNESNGENNQHSEHNQHSQHSDAHLFESSTDGGFACDAHALVSGLRKARVANTGEAPCKDADEIAAHPDTSLVYPSSAEIAQCFTSDGLLGTIYPDFEPRQEQQQMAEAVRQAFERSEQLVVEAGTGVGKSMAYLVPESLFALQNGVSVGVATKTNALLDQLMFQELPALQKALATSNPKLPLLRYVSLKGFSHYPCLRRLERIVQDGAHTKEVNGERVSQAPSIAALLSFVEQSSYDDMDSLKLDYRVLPRRRISTTSNECLRRKCPYYNGACFVHGQRRRAERAHVVLTNHSLLFCDVVTEGGLLPPIRHWVIDEAHGAEAEARRAFSIKIEAERLLHIARRVGTDESSRNVFIATERRVNPGDNEERGSLFYALCAKARAAGIAYADAAETYVQHMKDLGFFVPSKKGHGYDLHELWVNAEIRASETFATMAAYGKALVEKAEALVLASQNLVAFLEGIDGAASIQRDIASITLEVKEQLEALDLFLFHSSERYAYAATLSKKNERIVEKQEALLLDVGERLNETLYARSHSVVFASATLSIDGSCKAFERALGINAGEFSRAQTKILPSSFDFDNHMIIYVVQDMPEPNDPAYLESLQALLVKTHRALRGSVLSLFTNRRDMEACFKVVQPELKKDDLRVVCQKWGVSIKGLRDDFLADEHLSLFALKSFWEGFDAPGATLKGVLIPKLPFAKPSDPLSCERAARDDAAWRKYVLPQAILETKQAAGRLIRKASDSGVLILADKRLLTKSYGKPFLRSMPSRTIKVLPVAEIVNALQSIGVLR